MVGFKKLPNDPAALADRLRRLKDKEARLEADLAIKDHPALEAAITHVVLAMADVRKMDATLLRSNKPAKLEDRKQVEALVKQIEFYKHKLTTAKELLREKGGRDAEKYAETRQSRVKAFNQLQFIFEQASEVFESQGLNLTQVIPSIADFIGKEAGKSV